MRNTHSSVRVLVLAALVACSAMGGARAADEAPLAVTIRDHRFVPPQIEIPSGQKRQLQIDNQDASAEEFESHSLHREKIIPANSRASVFIGPLKPGRYEFFGEFNESTARGVIIAR